MKTKPKLNTDKGEGHKARIIASLKSTIEMDGEKHEFNFDYDLSITIEHVDYVVRQIAGGIAQAASKIARDGITEREPVVATS
jgi:hypothetical protein